MIEFLNVDQTKVNQIVAWLHENVATSRSELGKPVHVSAVSRILYYYSVDMQWEVMYYALGRRVKVKGLTVDEEIMLRLTH